MSIDNVGSPGPFLNGSAYPQESSRDGGAANTNDALASDDSMERIRDLIVGDVRRGLEAKLHVLETRLQSLEDKLDALRHDAASARDAQLSGLASGIDELGQHIRRLVRP